MFASYGQAKFLAVKLEGLTEVDIFFRKTETEMCLVYPIEPNS